MPEDVFLSSYTKLNREQKKAVDAIEGPVMVIAGPGTGKTSILTLRIANILRKTDTPPNGVLALTFTESAVHSMRKKLFEYIGASTYRVHLYTFHGFAQEIITRYPEYFPRIIGGIIATDSERYEIIEQALTKGEFAIIRPFGEPFFYVRKALGAIQDIKREGVTPEDFFNLLLKEEARILSSADLYHEKGRSKGLMKREHKEALKNNAKNKELGTLYASYEGLLKDRKLYDYDDMLLELVRALKEEEELLRTLQEEYLYILADEHQDANNSQNAILELLSDYRETRNLFIVGDEKQAIYRFQGASLENFLYFKKKFQDAEVIFLDHNYRSTQNILDATHALMTATSKEEIPRPRLLRASSENLEERLIHTLAFTSESDELLGLAHRLKEKIRQGVPPENIAVLVRTNREIDILGRTFSGFGIPHTLFTDDDVLTDRDISKLLILLRAIVYPENDVLVGSMFLIDFLGLNPIDAVKLNREAYEKRLPPLEILATESLRSELFLPEKVSELHRKFLSWMKTSHNESVVDTFLKVIKETQFQEYLLTRKESLEKIEKLTKLYDEVKAFLSTHKGAKLKDFIESIDTLIRHGTPISFSRRSLGQRGVSVMTAHKSKGMEWQYVYITNATDGVWGNRRKMAGFHLPYPLGSYEEEESNQDERRLFYVALTRAKEHVFISHARTDSSGKERLVSLFVTELPESLTHPIQGEGYLASLTLIHDLKEESSPLRTLWDRKYLLQLFVDQGLNATALNSYLLCPWRYFFKNLVRLPDIPEKYLHFGNAVHASLKMFADTMREGREPKIKEVLEVFEGFLNRMPLSKRDLADSLKKGRTILPKYIESRKKDWHKETITEFSIRGVSVPLSQGGQVLLRGRIDKLELLPDGRVSVVDYKTGGRKTRNDILGQTKSSTGDMKRQLDFYRLLLELYDNGKYEMATGVIDFIEPDEKDRFFREHFEITHDDAELIGKEIIRVAEEIMSFSFWDRTCPDRDCSYCELRRVLIDPVAEGE